MLRYFLQIGTIFLLLGGISCTTTKKAVNPNQMMIGDISKKDFKKAPYKDWFDKEYNSYALDKNSLDKIKSKIKTKKVLVFFGSWCSDSRREVPRFIKILDYLNIKYRKVHITGLDRTKKAPNYQDNIYNIQYVPTFIIFDGLKEMGRIIETPEETLELDLVKILN